MGGEKRIGTQRNIDKYVERRKNSRCSEDYVIFGGRYDQQCQVQEDPLIKVKKAFWIQKQISDLIENCLHLTF